MTQKILPPTFLTAVENIFIAASRKRLPREGFPPFSEWSKDGRIPSGKCTRQWSVERMAEALSLDSRLALF
jgi:hypothetical protein